MSTVSRTSSKLSECWLPKQLLLGTLPLGAQQVRLPLDNLPTEGERNMFGQKSRPWCIEWIMDDSALVDLTRQKYLVQVGILNLSHCAPTMSHRVGLRRRVPRVPESQSTNVRVLKIVLFLDVGRTILIVFPSNFIYVAMSSNRALLRKLESEKKELSEDVIKLAKWNYAREPEFVRDRLKLKQITDEVSRIVRQSQSLKAKAEPILEKLEKKILNGLKEMEERSETMAQEFLKNQIPYDDFSDRYIELRKITNERRLLADSLRQHIVFLKSINESKIAKQMHELNISNS